MRLNNLLFAALIASTAVACFAAKSETSESATGAQSVEAGADGASDPDAFAPQEGDAGQTSCLDPTPINATLFPYKKALKATELTTLSDYFKQKTDADEDVSIVAWSATVSAGCAQCVFSDGSGASWTPMITKDDRLESVNRGGCIEIKSGKESCGRAYQQVTECRLEACIARCATQDDFTSCLQDAEAIFAGPCKAAYDVLETECGANNLGPYEQACKGVNWTFEGPIKAHCIDGN